MDDIVRAAHLTKPMLYRHYESKQELCVALLERCRSELVAAPLKKFDHEASDATARLRTMLDARLGHVEAHPADARLLFTPITGDAEVERTQRELWARQRATQLALLREFDPSLGDEKGAPLAEAVRSALRGRRPVVARSSRRPARGAGRRSAACGARRDRSAVVSTREQLRALVREAAHAGAH